MKYIIVDISYFIFYRYYAIFNWWKKARADIPLGNPIDNEEFVATFKRTFISKIKEIPKNLYIDKDEEFVLIAAKDCPRKNIWRHEFTKSPAIEGKAPTSTYKGTRNNDGFKGGPFFPLTYNSGLFKEAGFDVITYHNHLEADDGIAIVTKKLRQDPNKSDNMIYIIASDHDYMQLLDDPLVFVFNLAYRDLSQHPKFYSEPTKNLFMKIILGDKSDNILPVFEKCGVKTAEKYFHDRVLFQKKLKTSPNALNRFQHNTRLIDFNHIPKELVNEFYQSIENIL